MIQPLRQDDPNDAEEMGHRRRQARRIGRSRLDRFAIGALILAAGLLAASLYINVEMSETRDIERASAPELALALKGDAQEPRQKKVDGAEARERRTMQQHVGLPHNARLGRPNARGSSAGAPNNPEQASNPGALTPIDVPPQGAVDRQPEPAERPNRSVAANQPLPETDADTPAQTQDPNDREPDASAADMAQLETVQDTADGVVSPNITRAQFTTGIDDREPVDEVGSVFPTNGDAVRTLYYFTEIVNMSGETVTHRWEYEGVASGEISFAIGSNRWRTWSSKGLTKAMTGEWRVVVIDTNGNVIKTDSFEYAGP